MYKVFLSIAVAACIFSLTAFFPSALLAAKSACTEKAVKGSLTERVSKPNATFKVNKMLDMSDFDPGNPVAPTGETIKIAAVAPSSGPSAYNGQIYYAIAQWVAHDYNKRGGIMVEDKKS